MNLKHIITAKDLVSIILSDGIYFPAQGASHLAITRDQIMISTLTAAERMFPQWQALPAATELEIKFYTSIQQF